MKPHPKGYEITLRRTSLKDLQMVNNHTPESMIGAVREAVSERRGNTVLDWYRVGDLGRMVQGAVIHR